MSEIVMTFGSITKQLVPLMEDHTFCFVCNRRLDFTGKDYDAAQLASGYGDHKWDGSIVFLICEECKRKALERLVAETFKQRFRPIEGEWNTEKDTAAEGDSE